MQLGQIRALIDLVGGAGLSEFELTENGVHVRLKAKRRPAHAGVTADEAVRRDGTGDAPPAATTLTEGRSIVRAPLSGTFFASPSPFAPPFCRVGDPIAKNGTLCIIEAMKTMTQVASDIGGTLREVMVENGAAVEFGQPLFAIA